MGNMLQSRRRKTASEIEAQAAAWVARADDRELTDSERSELENWLQSDSRCMGAYARAMAVSSHFDRAAALGPGYSPSYFKVARQPARILGRRHFMLAGSAAAAMLAIYVGAGSFADPERRIVTSKGDMRRIALPEGSAITLNTDSQVEPRIRAQMREVSLYKGEAIFDVAHDKTRPFVVQAGPVKIRVLGTTFSVRRFEDDSVEVAVFEGLVEIIGSEGGRRERLRSGERSQIRPDGDVLTEILPRTALERRVAWRQGVLDLNGMTLAEAVAEYGRYSNQRIEISDAATGALRLTGVYSTSDPMGFARAAAVSFHLRITPVPGGVRLEPY